MDRIDPFWKKSVKSFQTQLVSLWRRPGAQVREHCHVHDRIAGQSRDTGHENLPAVILKISSLRIDFKAGHKDTGQCRTRCRDGKIDFLKNRDTNSSSIIILTAV